MAKKTGISEEATEVQHSDEATPSEQSEQADHDEHSVIAESRVWVYLGPSIRGVVTNGRIFMGSKAEIIESFGDKLKEYPQIERLIIADKDVASARNDLKAKRGIYIPYGALINKIMGKEE